MRDEHDVRPVDQAVLRTATPPRVKSVQSVRQFGKASVDASSGHTMHLSSGWSASWMDPASIPPQERSGPKVKRIIHSRACHAHRVQTVPQDIPSLSVDTPQPSTWCQSGRGGSTSLEHFLSLLYRSSTVRSGWRTDATWNAAARHASVGRTRLALKGTLDFSARAVLKVTTPRTTSVNRARMLPSQRSQRPSSFLCSYCFLLAKMTMIASQKKATRVWWNLPPPVRVVCEP